MKNTITVIVAAICILCTTTTYAQTWQWARQNNTGYQIYSPYVFGNIADPKVATDAFGNVYMFGSYCSPSISFGSFTLTNLGFENMFLVKYDSLGNVLWAKSFGSSATGSGGGPSSQAVALSTDALGNVYITGLSGPDIHFGALTLGSGMFLAKYNTSGILQWAKVYNAYVTDMNNDPMGNLYIIGHYYDTVTFDSIVLNNFFYRDFITKFDTNGFVTWAKGFGSDSGATVTSVAVDNLGNATVVGKAKGDSLHFGIASIPIVGSPTYLHFFLTKYDSSGNIVWTKSAGGNGDDIIDASVADDAGNIYIIGTSYSDSMQFGAIWVPYVDMFLIKYDPYGNFVWSRVHWGINDVISKDNTGNLYLAGSFVGHAIFNSDTLLSAGYFDVLIEKWDTAGNGIWAKTAGGHLEDIGSSIAINNEGHAYIAGHYISSVIHFDSDSLTNTYTTHTNLFIAKLDTTTMLGLQVVNNDYKCMDVYPNPNNGIFSILLPKINNRFAIEIFDIYGKLIATKSVDENGSRQQQIDMSKMPKGEYIINVKTDNENITDKIIIK